MWHAALQDGKNEDTSALIETVNRTGKAFLITTDLSGRTVARIACGGFLTQVCDASVSLAPAIPSPFPSLDAVVSA